MPHRVSSFASRKTKHATAAQAAERNDVHRRKTAQNPAYSPQNHFLVLLCSVNRQAGLNRPVPCSLFENYRLIGGWPVWVAARVLPPLEILSGMALLFGRYWRMAGLVWVFGMLMVFVVALLSAWVRGLDIDCGCFGAAFGNSIPMALMKNTLLIGLSFWLWSRVKP